jgi:hypothetical protein
MFNSLQIFSDTCLLTLRIEIRCHAFFFLDLAFIEGNYELEDEPSELDPYIIELNQDMVKAEEAISSIMPLDRVRFVFEGMDIAINKIVEKVGANPLFLAFVCADSFARRSEHTNDSQRQCQWETQAPSRDRRTRTTRVLLAATVSPRLT